MPETELTIGHNRPQSETDMLANAGKLGRNWRNGREALRLLARDLIVTSLLDGFALGPLIGDCKKEMQFVKMDKADKNGVNVFVHSINTIAEKWNDMPQELKDKFISSPKTYPYSALIADIKKAEKKAEAEAEAEKAKAEAEAQGLTMEEVAALNEREADASANIAAIERIIAALASDSVKTDSENAAFVRLFDMVAAFETAAVKEAVAA